MTTKGRTKQSDYRCRWWWAYQKRTHIYTAHKHSRAGNRIYYGTAQMHHWAWLLLKTQQQQLRLPIDTQQLASIRVVQWNAQGFTPGKRDAFLDALRRENIPVDILLISETYRAEYDLIGSLKSEYASVHHCGYGNRGGTLVAIRKRVGLQWKRLEPQPLICSIEPGRHQYARQHTVHRWKYAPKDQRWSLTISSRVCTTSTPNN